jgi:hypothetical protein
MRRSYYDSSRRIIPKRAAGYDKTPTGYVNAEYLSMTQPYAAGGLASTVDDLAIWDAALTAGTLLHPETLQRAWTPCRLADGTLTTYGYGWGFEGWQGSKTIEHGGGIHGFLTFALRMPEERVFVAVLFNTTGGITPELMALKIAGLVIGKPFVQPAPLSIAAEELAAYTGAYNGADGAWNLKVEEQTLFAQPPHGPFMSLSPIATDTFLLESMPLVRLVFTREADTVTGLELHGRSGLWENLKRNEQPAT